MSGVTCENTAQFSVHEFPFLEASPVLIWPWRPQGVTFSELSGLFNPMRGAAVFRLSLSPSLETSVFRLVLPMIDLIGRYI